MFKGLFNFKGKTTTAKTSGANGHGKGQDTNGHGNRRHRHTHKEDGPLGSSEYLMNIYRDYPFAKKGIDIPIDDAFTTGRTITITDTNGEPLKNEVLENQVIETLKDNDRELKKLLKLAGITGVALLTMTTNDAEECEPLNLNYLNEWSLKNYRLFNKEHIKTSLINTNIMSDQYKKAEVYILKEVVNSQKTLETNIHYSRIIRSSSYDDFYDDDTGKGTLERALNEILREESIASNINLLLEKSNIDVIYLKNFFQKMCDKDTVNSQAYLQSIQDNLDIYNVMMLDSENKFSRDALNFGGLMELNTSALDKMGGVFDIPVSRYLSKTISSLNNTNGDDLENYGKKVQGIQTHDIAPFYKQSDTIVENMYNVRISYKFNNPLELSETDKVNYDQIVIANTKDMILSEAFTIKQATEYAERNGLIEANYKELMEEDGEQDDEI